MNRSVLFRAISDLKKIICEIEKRTNITEEDCICLEKEVNSFLANLSSYKLRNIRDKNKLLSAFQYAFNLVKHETKIISVKKIKQGGFSFPIHFPLIIPCNEVSWIDASNIKPEKNFKKQYEAYLMKLNNKRIIDTINELEEII